MPTAISHPAVALGILPCFRAIWRYPVLIVVAIFLSIAPDLDIIGFRLGIPYDHLLGHRGLSHSLPFALVVSLVLAWMFARRYPLSSYRLAGFFFISMASHGVLDALTSGGLGVAFFAPFSEIRYFFEIRPIAIAPLSVERFFSARGLVVLVSEIKWVWLPMFGVAIVALVVRFLLARRAAVLAFISLRQTS